MNELMRRIKYQNVLIVLLMLIFGGQAIASASISCQNPSSSSDQALISGMMDHAQHSGLKAPNDATVSLDYCPDCDCDSHHCFTSVMTILNAQNLFTFGVASLISPYHEAVDAQSTSSLFRPPISR